MKNTNPSLPEFLYKYRKFDDINHIKTIKEGKLFLSSPKFFEDNDDFTIEFDWDNIEEQDIIKTIKITGINNNLEDKIIQDKIIEYTSNKKSFLDKYKKDFAKKFWRKNLENHGVLCLCKNPNSEKMWIEYAGGGHGFILKFKSDTAFFRNPPAQFPGVGSDVIYTNNFIKIPPFKILEKSELGLPFLFHRLVQKSTKFSHEEEYRFWASGFANIEFEYIPSGLVEVIIGNLLTETQRKCLILYAKKINPNVSVTLR